MTVDEINDLEFNKGLVERINAYWGKRGVGARARVVERRVVKRKANVPGGREIVTLFTIASDLTGREAR